MCAFPKVHVASAYSFLTKQTYQLQQHHQHPDKTAKQKLLHDEESIRTEGKHTDHQSRTRTDAVVLLGREVLEEVFETTMLLQSPLELVKIPEAAQMLNVLLHDCSDGPPVGHEELSADSMQVAPYLRYIFITPIVRCSIECVG
jgi:hypothetical protein